MNYQTAMDWVLDYLRDYQRKDSVAAIAGGFIRDSLLLRPAKDIDVFVWGLNMERLQSDHGVQAFPFGDYSSSRIRRQFEVAVPRVRYPVNIVELKERQTFDQILNDMDMGICQAGYTYGMSQPVFTTAFMLDAMSANITVLRDDGPKTTRRIARLLEKYPGWHVNRPLDLPLPL